MFNNHGLFCLVSFWLPVLDLVLYQLATRDLHLWKNDLGSYDGRFVQVQVRGKLKVLGIGPGLQLRNA